MKLFLKWLKQFKCRFIKTTWGSMWWEKDMKNLNGNYIFGVGNAIG